ncbi:ribosomal protein S12 methylthiotransferase [Porphyromonadaceae bacterium COT-184 OH4590]|nr:ribosomal protein S12 methylthiotransferase [Porphyromonadaceae bacterium COT-184 OH4590]
MRKGVIDVITLGCSKNLVDSERLMKQFAANGYVVRHEPAKVGGEIVVVNTCGFIGSAKEESINTILSLVDAKRQRKIGQLIVMGCLSERYRDELKAEIPEVDRFYGKFDWKQIVADIGLSYNRLLENERLISTPNSLAYLKISEGCDRTCSYCAIPIITGKHRSRSIEDITSEVENLISQGVKEFNLIAQDLTYYGADLYGKQLIAALVDKIAQIKGVEWLRLHYAYPAKFPKDLLKVIADNDNVCNYLDMALQHISDNMLAKMRRNITKTETYDLISEIRSKVPDIHLRTTLMLGHPFETEQDFEELKEFVQTIKFERLGAFSYSHEEGTFCDKNYVDNIPFEIKNQRVSDIMDIQERIAEEHNQNKVGRELKVIIDKKDTDYYIGRTEYDSPEVDGEVLIKRTKKLKIGNFYNVKITDSQAFDLFGEVI